MAKGTLEEVTPMLWLNSSRKRDRLPTLFVAFWSVTIIGLTIHAWQQSRLNWWTAEQSIYSPPQRINLTNYDAIDVPRPPKLVVQMFEGNVAALLGGQGLEVKGLEWPSKISELPGWQESGRDDKLTWKKWVDPADPDKWIAVGFVIVPNWRGDYGITVAKKKNGL